MSSAGVHTQLELSVGVLLQAVMVGILWFGTFKGVPKVVARLAGEAGNELPVEHFRFVFHTRDAPWVFGSLLGVAVFDDWLTFGGPLLGSVFLWAGSMSAGLIGTVVGLEGRPSWGVQTRFRGGLRSLSNAKDVRLRLYGRGSFSPVVWVGVVMVAYGAASVCSFVVAPRMEAILGNLVGAQAPFWVLFWTLLPTALTVRSVSRTAGDGDRIWPDWVRRLMVDRFAAGTTTSHE